jgi:aminopeptidase N
MGDRRVAAAVLLAGALAGCGGSGSSAPPGPAPEALMGPGVSLALARQRAATISNVEYDLALDVTGSDTVPGMVTVGFDRRGDDDLVVDFRGLALHEVRVNGEPVEDFVWNDGHVRIPAKHLARGPNSLGFRFSSRMAAAGASVIRFEEPAGANGPGDTYLYTLLVPADANQLFPCFDQPDLKAVFRLEMVAPEGWTVLANGPVADTLHRADGTWWRFAPTRPISTYLAAFAAGPWRVWSDSTAGKRPISLYARRGRAKEVEVDSLISTNRRALEWLERYFGIPYPFQKFAFLLAPAFPFGGMEHPGAIFYNESRFVFREPPTLPERLGRSATIYHEVAHQWFGDLVTMQWFDDLWLKEGFATYMAAKMQEDLEPGTGAWKTFYLRNEPLAYGVDVTRGTSPIWQELENLDLAKSNYGPIVYNKAPAILKQLEYWVGEEAFRRGLQELLRRHAYGNITWRDLLAALERSSGEELDAFGEAYVLRAGAPVVSTVLETTGGTVTRLALVQRPAVELPGQQPGWWPGKIRVRLGYAGGEDVVLPVAFSGDTTVVAAAAGLPAPDYVFANDGDYGYGIFLPDSTSATYLAAHVGELDDDLLRALTWGALWDLVRVQRLSPAAFLEIAMRELPRERDEQIASVVLRTAAADLSRYLPEGSDPALRERFEALLVRRMEDERLSYDLRKSALDAFLSAARTPASLRMMEEMLAGRRGFAGAPLREPSRWTAIETLLAQRWPGADSLFAAERRRAHDPEAERRAFVAGAATPTAESKAEYFRRYLEDPELNEEWVMSSLGAFNRPEQDALTLPYLRPALERLPWIQQNRRIFFLPQWVNAFVLGQRSPEALKVVDDYLAAHPELSPDLRRKVYEARDALEEIVRIRTAAR